MRNQAVEQPGFGLFISTVLAAFWRTIENLSSKHPAIGLQLIPDTLLSKFIEGILPQYAV